jgi:DNA-directed RNA polymerase specialized sigma24 family protein
LRRIPDSLVETFTPYDAVEAADEQRIARETVAAFLPRLKGRSRKVFEARFLSEKSYREICEEHDLSLEEAVGVAVQAFGELYAYVHTNGDVAGRMPDKRGSFLLVGLSAS